MSRELNPAVIENNIISQLRQLSSNNIRTSLFNLLLFYDIKDQGTIEDLLSSIFGKRPARIIHIRNKDADLTNAYVKVRCHADYEQNQVCFQEIIIENGLDNIGIAVGAWLPLCTHDIPIIVIWLCRLIPFEDLVQTFYGIADKIIFCTEFNETKAEDPFAVCLNILKLILSDREHPSHPRLSVSDFTWLKSLPLRQKTAALFDPKDMRSALYDLNKIIISGTRRSVALLYFLWLASRLDWNLIHKDDSQLQFHDHKRDIITVQLADDHRKRIVFATKENQEFTLSWQSLYSSTTDAESMGKTTSRSRPFGAQEQVLRELDSPGPNLLYYNALKKLSLPELSEHE
ncbi:MAG: glucose-6-phosphate dehydrogenase assembly protein OpcA [Spirochaetales bacterium]|nr:glucose-6-phosphate dehydrogenase assembly protein OpcA [Spirochaetales bacterium]